MMTFTPLDEAMYDKVQVEIGYAKLFPHIMDDFVTRLDCKEMMKGSNLIVTTDVATAVVTTTDTGTGKGKGSGQVLAVYKASAASAGSRALAVEKKAMKDAGGIAAKAAIGAAE